MALILTDLKGKETIDPSLEKIQKAITDLFIFNPFSSNKENKNKNRFISIFNNETEIALEIYHQTIIAQDYGLCGYDGPGGPGELIRKRYKEGSLIYIIDKVINSLENFDNENIVKLLKSLPEPLAVTSISTKK